MQIPTLIEGGSVCPDRANQSRPRKTVRTNGRNPLPIVVPCHRVIGSDGSLTGYGGGLWRKRWLIGFERGEVVQPPTDIIA